MDAALRDLALSSIDLGFDRFSPSWPAESKALAESIAAAGLIVPPLLAQRGAALVAVCGLRRLRAAAGLGLARASCLVLADCAWTDPDLLALNMEENLATRQLSLIEWARFAALSAAFDAGARRRLRGRFIPRLGAAGGAAELDRLELLDRLPDDVKQLVAAKRLALRQALPWARLDPASASVLADLAASCRLTASQAAELVEAAPEISSRDGKSLAAVARELGAAVEDARLRGGAGGPAPRDLLTARLRTWRFPERSAADAALAADLDSVNGAPGVKVSPPPFLEGDAFRAELSFASAEELLQRLAPLRRFAESAAGQRAFRLLRGEDPDGAP